MTENKAFSLRTHRATRLFLPAYSDAYFNGKHHVTVSPAHFSSFSYKFIPCTHPLDPLLSGMPLLRPPHICVRSIDCVHFPCGHVTSSHRPNRVNMQVSQCQSLHPQLRSIYGASAVITSWHDDFLEHMEDRCVEVRSSWGRILTCSMSISFIVL